jgi:hypothetical protein
LRHRPEQPHDRSERAEDRGHVHFLRFRSEWEDVMNVKELPVYNAALLSRINAIFFQNGEIGNYWR